MLTGPTADGLRPFLQGMIHLWELSFCWLECSLQLAQDTQIGRLKLSTVDPIV